MSKRRTVYLSYDTGSDADGVSGLTTASPLKTIARAAQMYGRTVTMNTTYRLACGEVWREKSTWELATEYETRFEPWEKSAGDYDILGRPTISGGALMPNWTASAGNWYSEDLILDFDGEVNKRVLMIDYVVQRRRDRRLTGDLIWTGEMTPGTLEEGEWAWEESTGRVWIGTNPTGKTVELSIRDKGIVIPGARNLTIDSLQIMCTTGSTFALDSVDGERRTIALLNSRFIGSFSAAAVGGGDDILIKDCEFAHGLNSLLTFNRGLAGHILVEDTHCWSHEDFGTGPNGYYDDRVWNDCLTFHNDGGAVATVRRVNCHGANENALDIQAGRGDNGGWQRIYVYDSTFAKAGQFVAVVTAPASLIRCTFADSARGLSIKYDRDVGPTKGPQGTVIDQCVIVGTGNPARGVESSASGIQYFGVTGSDEAPVVVARTYLTNHPDANRPLVTLVQQQWLPPPAYPLIGDSQWYTPSGLKFINSQLHNQADQPLFSFGNSDRPVPTTAMEAIGCAVWHGTSGNPVSVSEVPQELGTFMQGAGYQSSRIQRPRYIDDNTDPLTVEEVIDTGLPMRQAMIPLGPAPALVGASSTAA